MSSNRVVYQNWIADLGRDPGVRPDPHRSEFLLPLELADPEVADEEVVDPAAGERQERVRQAVAAALGKLEDDEREFVERYYFMGRSYREIAESSGRAVHRLEALHQRAIRKLRKELAPLATELYGLRPATNPECPICRSSERVLIDDLITQRDKAETWRPVMQKIEELFGIHITTPQVLIGHQKYH